MRISHLSVGEVCAREAVPDEQSYVAGVWVQCLGMQNLEFRVRFRATQGCNDSVILRLLSLDSYCCASSCCFFVLLLLLSVLLLWTHSRLRASPAFGCDQGLRAEGGWLSPNGSELWSKIYGFQSRTSYEP